jgi:hypothetical protein
MGVVVLGDTLDCGIRGLCDPLWGGEVHIALAEVDAVGGEVCNTERALRTEKMVDTSQNETCRWTRRPLRAHVPP